MGALLVEHIRDPRVRSQLQEHQMRRIATVLAALAISVVGFAPAASASQLCYDVHVNVAGNEVAQADCVDF